VVAARVEVFLLGPVEVRVDARPLPVSGAKLQALLALLALSAPRAVSDDSLIEELWGDALPRKPANALQAQIAQLRRVIGREAISRDTFGYALSADVDVDRFEHLARTGRTAAGEGDQRRAAESFAAAIALVRGPFFDDLLDHRFAREAASRLDQVAIGTHEGLVDAELALGHHADVLPVLLNLVASHPLWERFHGQLMVALFRCGRQSDALRAYQHARAVLADEMGVEPGPELRALERAVLSHDPSLVAPIPLALAAQRAPLPVPATPFVGRELELSSLERIVRTGRLVTIIGTAGAGKTRLAAELIRRAFSEHDVWFLELAPIDDPALVAETVAAAVGGQDSVPRGGNAVPRSPEARIIDRLADRVVIVVLDNCEHVRTATASLTDQLLEACEGLQILATSREPLGLDREQQFALGPLNSNDASLLFADRAGAVARELGASPDEIANLCHRLDRLPLAIELAAARTKSMGVADISARLNDRFSLLNRGRTSGDERHRGLRAAIDWSYDLLSQDEQRSFGLLAVFAGGATLDAAQLLLGPGAIDAVSTLVDKSLLLADTPGGSVRFRMLETLRLYGRDRLAERGELRAANDLHCRWCIELAERAEIGVRGPDQLVWLDRLDAEHDNIRAALGHALDSDPTSALRLIGALILPWWFRGRGREARQWVEACLDAVTDPDPGVLAKALTWSGLLADFDGRAERRGAFEAELHLADRRQRQAIELAIDSEDEQAIAYARSQCSLSLVRAALAGVPVDLTDVRWLIADSLAAFERLGDEFGAGETRLIEAVAALATGRLDEAALTAESARRHALRSGDRFVLGRVEWIAGLAADAGGDAAEAYRRVEQGLRLLDELGMKGEVTGQASLLAALAERRGEPDLAAQWRRFVAAYAGGLRRHDVLVLAAARNSEGLRARRFGHLEQARHAHLAALEAHRKAGVLGGLAFTESCLGFLAAEAGDLQDAATHHAAALVNARAAGDPASLALALEGAAGVMDDDHALWAARLLGAADHLWHEAGDPARATHRDDTQALTAHLRSVLGVSAFSEAWEHGRQVDRADAIAIASTASTRL
jgi:predicted ATPase/DNA-binding SARP family transcriptional activator